MRSACATRRWRRADTRGWARASGCWRPRRRYPDRLRVELDALVTRVLFDEQQPRDRRRIPEGRTALPRAWPAGTGSWRCSPGAGDARGHPQRRRLQYTATPDAVGHRAARGAGAARDPGAGRSCRESARTCRTATRSASSTAWLRPLGTSSKALTFSRGDRGLPGMGRKARRRLHQQRRGAVGDPEIATRAAASRPVLLRIARPFRRVLSRAIPHSR